MVAPIILRNHIRDPVCTCLYSGLQIYIHIYLILYSPLTFAFAKTVIAIVRADQHFNER